MQRLLTFVLSVVLTVTVSATVSAQGGGPTSSIAGTVVDASGAVLPGANVVAKNVGTGAEYTTVSSEQGTFSIPALTSGTYTVTVTLTGFRTAVLNDVVLTAAGPATVRAVLAVGGLEETVVVEGASAIVQTQTAAVATTMDINQISNLPLTSRSALDFVTNLPGINTPGGSRDSTVNGLPQSAINITIDGMSAQDNYLKTTDGFFARVSPRLDSVEEVTVSTAAQDVATTGQGAVQIRFVTRSGTNNLQGSTFYYLRHHNLNANTWFNNATLPPDPATGKAPKAENITHQPGTRVGGPISIPGLFDGRDKAFFFLNYEQSRTPGQITRNRDFLHPSAQAGIFRYNVGGQVREVNLLSLAARNGHVSTPDPTIAGMLNSIRAATGTTGQFADLTNPSLQRYTFQQDSEGLTHYTTGRVDFNLGNNHRLYSSFNYNDLLSTPDTTNNRESRYPGFPLQSQDSLRYTVQGTLRSTLGSNLVNELRIGGTGGRTLFSPELAATNWTNDLAMGGYHLNFNNAMGIANPIAGPANSSREASTKVVENTLNWIKGSHALQMGGGWTRGDVWLKNQMKVPQINFGIASGDPADAMFTPANFPGANNTDLTNARNLYAMLTGRVRDITGEARLDEAIDEYRYLGESVQRARIHDFGFYVADTWRWKPNFTLNLGLRYELQQPFRPLNNSYSTATLADVCGVSGIGADGVCNLFQPTVQTGQKPVFIQYNEGDAAYETDRNNFAPNIGFAWSLGGGNGMLSRIFGTQEADSVIGAGYSLGYNRPGMSDFTGEIDDNPGVQISANREQALGNLGAPGSVFVRNPAQLGPPAIPLTRVYPMTDVITGDVHIFARDLQVPYSQSWTASWQRVVSRNMSVTARYVGTRALQSWGEFNYNELNIVENGFLDEFRLAQQNLRANIAAGRGSTFRYFGSNTGTSPLPIFLAYFSGTPRAQAGNASLYTSTQFSNSTFVNPLAIFNPQPFAAANALDADSVRISNALRAGLPANFLVANPDLLGGAEVTANSGYNRFDGAQFELKRRMSDGFQFYASYAFGKAYISERYSLRTPRQKVLDTGAEGGVTHAFKANWVYELPFGEGRRFGAGSGPWVNRLIGGWFFDGIARIQSGRLLDFGNVRLVGMTKDEFQKAVKLRFDNSTGGGIYMLPQDIIDNTVKAFSVSATSLTGYGQLGPPEGRYLAPANGPDCIELAQTTEIVNNNPVPNIVNGFGNCGINNLIATGPRQVRFDLSVGKRTRISGDVNFEFRAEMLNAFNHPWFIPVTGIDDDNESLSYNRQDLFRVDSVGENSSRIIQLVFRVNW
jgi:Carboxypeptidase regulatory-like domain